MVSDHSLNKLYTFLFFNCFDAEQSKLLLRKALIHVGDSVDQSEENQFLEITKFLIKKSKSAKHIEFSEFSEQANLSFVDSTQINLQSWFEYCKKNNDQFQITFLLSQVLNLNDQEVSDMLGTSVGTIRHRISNSYEMLSKGLKYV